MMVANSGSSGHNAGRRSLQQQLQNSEKTPTARLLVLGDKRVGKSAAIVRYTTDRYIQDYSNSTSNWLYRHSTGFEPRRNCKTCVELLEQKDIEFNNFSNAQICKQTTKINGADEKLTSENLNQSLASRVARDQRLASEQNDLKEMLNKLRWANAYVVIYAVNDVTTFNKAIKYLNFIANNINNSRDQHKGSLSGRGSTSSNGSSKSNGSSSCNSFNSNFSSHKLVSPSHATSDCRVLGIDGDCSCCTSAKRPILLLGNKSDLGESGRQVSSRDGRLLAMRHQSMFVELSIAESSILIKSSLATLIDQIETVAMYSEHEFDSVSIDANLTNDCTGPSSKESQTTKLVQWIPTNESTMNQANPCGLAATPIWASLVRSSQPRAAVAQSSKVSVGTGAKATGVQPIRPLGSLVKSVESARVCQPMMACNLLKAVKPTTAVEHLKHSDAKEKSTISNSLSYHDRYESLKRSIKKASMAIVSSKTLVRGTKHAASKPTRLVKPQTSEKIETPQHEAHKKNSLDSQYSVCTSASCASEPVGSGTVITIDKLPVINSTGAMMVSRKHSSLKVGSCNSLAPATIAEQFAGYDDAHSGLVSSRKNLFSYKSRRKTVAFDHKSVVAPQVDSENQLVKTEIINDSLCTHSSCDYNSPRCSSGRSSSSLSNSDINQHGSLFVTGNSERSTSSTSSNQTAPISDYHLNRRDSRSNLSYTSSGSYEDGGCQDLAPGKVSYGLAKHELKLPKQSSEYANNMNRLKKRNQLVKTVQSTMSNLTRSSNTSGQSAKRSICKTLFRHSPSGAPVTVRKIALPEVKLAETEQIRLIPSMAAACK